MNLKCLRWFAFYALVSSVLLTEIRARKNIASVVQKVQSTLKGVRGNTKGVLTSLSKLKDDLVKNPDRAEKAGEFLEKVDSALGKFNEGKAIEIVSGCLDIVAGIASAFGGPIGLGIGAVASFISSILSLFTGEASESVGEIIDSALRKHGDNVLHRDASGAKRDFRESAAFINIVKKKVKPTELDLSVIAANVPIYKFSAMLGTLESRILQGAATSDLTHAERTVDFILLYCQLVVMRETLLLDLVMIYRRSGVATHIADAVADANRVNKKIAKESLTFLHNLHPQQAVLGAVYHPIQNSKRSQAILAYSKYFGVPPPPKSLDGRYYRFQNVYWPSWSICTEAYMGNYMFRGCPNIGFANLLLKKYDGGYYTLQNRKKRKLYITKHKEGWGWGTIKNDPGPQGHLIFVPLKSGHYMVSTEKWPDYFMYMSASASGYIKSYQGNPGPEGHWKLY